MRRIALLPLFGLLLSGCGIGFGSGPDGTEVFQRLAVQGELRLGQPATLVVTWEQPYPVDIDVECFLKRGKKAVQVLGGDTIPGSPGADPTDPEQTPETGSFSFDFVPEQAGSYKLECETPADDNNAISETVTVLPP